MGSMFNNPLADDADIANSHEQPIIHPLFAQPVSKLVMGVPASQPVVQTRAAARKAAAAVKAQAANTKDLPGQVADATQAAAQSSDKQGQRQQAAGPAQQPAKVTDKPNSLPTAQASGPGQAATKGIQQSNPRQQPLPNAAAVSQQLSQGAAHSSHRNNNPEASVPVQQPKRGHPPKAVASARQVAKTIAPASNNATATAVKPMPAVASEGEALCMKGKRGRPRKIPTVSEQAADKGQPSSTAHATTDAKTEPQPCQIASYRPKGALIDAFAVQFISNTSAVVAQQSDSNTVARAPVGPGVLQLSESGVMTRQGPSAKARAAAGGPSKETRAGPAASENLDQSNPPAKPVITDTARLVVDGMYVDPDYFDRVCVKLGIDEVADAAEVKLLKAGLLHCCRSSTSRHARLQLRGGPLYKSVKQFGSAWNAYKQAHESAHQHHAAAAAVEATASPVQQTPPGTAHTHPGQGTSATTASAQAAAGPQHGPGKPVKAKAAVSKTDGQKHNKGKAVRSDTAGKAGKANKPGSKQDKANKVPQPAPTQTQAAVPQPVLPQSALANGAVPQPAVPQAAALQGAVRKSSRVAVMTAAGAEAVAQAAARHHKPPHKQPKLSKAVTQVNAQVAAGPAKHTTGVAAQPKDGRAIKAQAAPLAAASSSTRVDLSPTTAGLHQADTTVTEQDVIADAAPLPGLGKRRSGQPTAEASIKSSRAGAPRRPREPESYDSAASSSEASALGQAQHDVEAAEALGMLTASRPSPQAHAPAENVGFSASHVQFRGTGLNAAAKVCNKKHQQSRLGKLHGPNAPHSSSQVYQLGAHQPAQPPQAQPDQAEAAVLSQTSNAAQPSNAAHLTDAADPANAAQHVPEAGHVQQSAAVQAQHPQQDCSVLLLRPPHKLKPAASMNLLQLQTQQSM